MPQHIAIQLHTLQSTLRVMTGLFQNGGHEQFMLVLQYQQLHFMLAFGIKLYKMYILWLYQCMMRNLTQIGLIR